MQWLSRNKSRPKWYRMVHIKGEACPRIHPRTGFTTRARALIVPKEHKLLYLVKCRAYLPYLLGHEK